MGLEVPGVTDEAVEKYQFDGFELYPKQRALWRAGERVAVMPKPIQTLLLLVEHAGQTVTKEELITRIWNGAAVEENNLTQSISALRRVLGEKRGENRFIVTDPGRGYRFVASVSRVIEPVAAPVEAAREPFPVPSLSSGRRRVVAIAVVSLLAFGGWALQRLTSAPPVRRSVAVLPVRDLSKGGAEGWLQTALTEMLTSELSTAGKLRTVPSEDVARWRADSGAAGDLGRRSDLLRSAQQNLGADILVLGSYVVTGNCPDCRVRVDLGLANVRSGERVGTVIEEGSATDLLDLASRAGRRLRAELGAGAERAASPRWPAASAMREYAEGLTALRSMDPIAARDHFQVALAADPANPLIHSALADTWTALGYGSRATDEAQRAYDLSGSLDRLDKLGIEARYRLSLQQWDRAIGIYRTIFDLFPDSLDDGLNLARAEWRALRISDAHATLAALRRFPQPLGNDPRIDLLEAQAAGSLNDYARTKALAHRAAEEAKKRGARYLFARARLLEGGAMQTMFDWSSSGVQDEARQTCEAIGDRECVSKAWRIRGNHLFNTGNFQAARQAYERGIAIARELGNGSELANLLVGFGVLAKADRDWEKAEQDLREAIALREETGYNPNEVRNVLAAFYIEIGKLPDAETVIEAADRTVEKTGAHEDLGEMLRLKSELARSRGELDRAQKLAEQSVAELRRTNNPLILSEALADLSSVQTAKGNLSEAEKNLTEVGAKEPPEIRGAKELAHAEFWTAKGQFQSAAGEAQRAAASFDEAHLDGESARAFVTAADAFVMMNRNGDALAACREGEKRAARTPNRLTSVLAKLCSWSLSGPSRTIPPEIQGSVTDLQNPEVTLKSKYARVVEGRRSNSPDYPLLADLLAKEARRLGFIDLAQRTALLGQRF